MKLFKPLTEMCSPNATPPRGYVITGLNKIMIVATAILCCGPISAQERSDPLPWKVNKPIVSVKKELFAKHPRPGVAALGAIRYVGPKLEQMEYQGLEIVSDAAENNRLRFSKDNGRTWEPFEPVADKSPEVQGIGGGPEMYDSEAGVLLCIGMRQVAHPKYNNFIYSKYSRDYGKTWSKPKQLKYEPGADFDPKDPFKPSFLLQNQAYRGQSIIRCRNGALVHTAGLANDPNDPENDNRDWRMGGLCFIGRWDAKARDYTWKAGKRVATSPDVSSRGFLEPDQAELTDGRLLVAWRGSSTAKTAGHVWYSLSSDGGMTLGEPKEWKYDDGSSFYAPSAWHLFLRHSVTGRLYWFGNICAEPPDGNWRRYPLVIAEVDENKAALKRSTVTAIDDRQPGQGINFQLSNFSLLEDRETHDLKMILTTYCQEPDPSDWRNADAYKYTVKLK